MKGKKKSMLFIVIIILIAIIIVILNIPVSKSSLKNSVFTPLKDDELAKKFAPIIITNSEFKVPSNLYYRAAKDSEENIYIAYHIIWIKEENNKKGFKYSLYRALYSGGLRLREKIYGPGDIELVEAKLNKDGELIKISFNSPFNYNENDLFNKSKVVEVYPQNKDKINLKVDSWDHLFSYANEYNVKSESDIVAELKPIYFEEEFFKYYEIIKDRETILNKNREFFDYEISGV